MNFQLEEAYQSDSVKARVAEWKQRADAADWQALWVWDANERLAKPVFVRIGGKGAHADPGLKDSEGNEILEWEPGQEPTRQTPPRIIVGAPPAQKPGFFDQPTNIKVG
jgi:hypothetical protein